MSEPVVTLTIEVTKEHIDFGHARSCDNCPVALALLHAARLQWPTLWNDLVVSVERSRVRVWNGTLGDNLLDDEPPILLWCQTPDTIYNFIVAYDDGRHVAPFTLSLPLFNGVGD